MTRTAANPDEDLLHTDDVAAMLGMHPVHVRRLVRAGLIPAFQPGLREYRYHRKEIERYIAEKS